MEEEPWENGTGRGDDRRAVLGRAPGAALRRRPGAHGEETKDKLGVEADEMTQQVKYFWGELEDWSLTAQHLHKCQMGVVPHL